MADYRMTFDLHTHTAFCTAGGRRILHAKGSVEENVAAAAEKGLAAIGISNHGPGHLTYGMSLADVRALREEILEAQERHPEIQIYLGVEANIINPSGRLDLAADDFSEFDYIMAGYHYGILGEQPFAAAALHGANWLCGHIPPLRALAGGSLKRANTKRVLAAVQGNAPISGGNGGLAVLTHPGDKGPLDIDSAAAACAAAGTWMEINNYHRDLSVEAIRRAAKYDVSFIIGSDAHTPERVGGFERALERALEAGISEDRIVNIEKVEKTAQTEKTEQVGKILKAAEPQEKTGQAETNKR